MNRICPEISDQIAIEILLTALTELNSSNSDQRLQNVRCQLNIGSDKKSPLGYVLCPIYIFIWSGECTLSLLLFPHCLCNIQYLKGRNNSNRIRGFINIGEDAELWTSIGEIVGTKTKTNCCSLFMSILCK